MNSSFHLTLKRFVTIFLFVFCASKGLAQTKNQGGYISPADQELTIKQVTVAPFTDNLSGIYANPLTTDVRDQLTQDPRWALKDFPARAVKSEKLDEERGEVQKILKETKSDALITGRVLKGPAGISLRMTLFAGPSGLPLLVEEANEPQRFEIERIKEIEKETLKKIRDRLPYKGLVLSRRAQEVTINLGKNEGLHEGNDVTAIQILKINRHPKLNLMISTEKEILGKIHLTKVDDELSFGQVTFEKEQGLVVPGMKIVPPEGISYPESKINDPSFGDKPVAWLPEPAPQYGRLQVLAGLGQYAQNVNLATSGTITGSNSLTPNLGVMAEGWFTREWWLAFQLRQSTFAVDNGLSSSGGTPSRLNVSLTKYDLAGGYTLLLGNDFFGPKIQFSIGAAKFSARADQSTPPLFSNMDFSGPRLGFLFNTPIGEGTPWDVGAQFKYFLSPTVSEGLSSGQVKSVSANDFSFLAGYRVRKNFRYVGELNIDYYNANFNGPGDRPSSDAASAISQRTTTIMAGLEYMF